jgi:hypothetical protein
MEEIERHFPEVFYETERPSRYRHSEYVDKFYLWDRIREWLVRAYPEEVGRYRSRAREGRREIPHPLDCTHPECPLKHDHRADSDRVSPHSPTAPAANSDEISIDHIDLMAAGGGAKPPLGAFLDMTQKVHSGKGVVKRLVVTDGYLFLSNSEHGTPGGIDNFIKYLGVLELPKGGNLEILVPPDARGKGKEAETIWSRTISEYGRGREVTVSIKYFKAGCHFHDRFYISQHENGEISGVFGPSLNGLHDKDFVLFGELEDNVIHKFKSYLQL